MVRYGVGTIEQSGYNGQQISFKSDQEPSLIALKSSIAATRIGETVPIESPVRSSKNNGQMENAVKIWQGQLRTIKHFVESRLGKNIEPGGSFVFMVDPVLLRRPEQIPSGQRWSHGLRNNYISQVQGGANWVWGSGRLQARARLKQQAQGRWRIQCGCLLGLRLEID